MDGRTNRQTDGQKQKEKRQKSGKRVGVRASAKNKNSFFFFLDKFGARTRHGSAWNLR
jgi:hypothetical protein